MHGPKEYELYFDTCHKTADELARKLRRESGSDLAVKVFDFLERHCYVAYPGTQVNRFVVGQYLSRPGQPFKQLDGIAWLMCFNDDVAPIPREKTKNFNTHGADVELSGAAFNRSAQAIIILDVNWWSPLELAAMWLHEGYHAWHRLRLKLDNIPSTENEERHETNAWIMQLNLLNVGGDQLWKEAIRQEVAWIKKARGPGDRIRGGRIVFEPSNIDWPEIDLLFGSTAHENVSGIRHHLVAVAAHMVYWSQHGLTPEQACHSIVTKNYQ